MPLCGFDPRSGRPRSAQGSSTSVDMMWAPTFLTSLCIRGGSHGGIATDSLTCSPHKNVATESSDLTTKGLARPGSTHVESVGSEILPSASAVLGRGGRGAGNQTTYIMWPRASYPLVPKNLAIKQLLRTGY